MRTLKHLVILSLVALVAVFLSAPSALAKKALTEDEMDLITAAGQPKIIQTGSGNIVFTDTPNFTLDLDQGSQTSLTALTLNNVAGENQVATGINVQSAGTANAGTQSNAITQSWGATKDWSSASVEGVSASASASASAAAGSSGTCFKCGVVKVGAAAASSSAAASTSTSAGVVKILTKYADQIIETETGDITVLQNGTSTLTLENGSQTTLSALVVNNVAGQSQVANGVNIFSGALTLAPSSVSVGAGGTFGGVANQTNTINQFRGTPYSRPQAP